MGNKKTSRGKIATRGFLNLVIEAAISGCLLRAVRRDTHLIWLLSKNDRQKQEQGAGDK
ncbi:MAG: hypothetical protein Q7U74_09085 [Saprospiraceae bacterium]|nr:hypothetical protein [Saprospiraceae bacterium]